MDGSTLGSFGSRALDDLGGDEREPPRDRVWHGEIVDSPRETWGRCHTTLYAAVLYVHGLQCISA